MSVHIDEQRCNGCGGLFRCADICPGSLLTSNEQGKAAVREPRDCWDCAACVKTCARGALALTLPLEVGGKGALLKAKTNQTAIRWCIQTPDKREEIIEIETKKII